MTTATLQTVQRPPSAAQRLVYTTPSAVLAPLNEASLRAGFRRTLLAEQRERLAIENELRKRLGLVMHKA